MAKAEVLRIWKMGAEGLGHAEDVLPDCPPPPTEEELKEMEKKNPKKKVDKIKDKKKGEEEVKVIEEETPLIKPKPTCKVLKNNSADANANATAPADAAKTAATLAQVKKTEVIKVTESILKPTDKPTKAPALV
jgi:hypothetical protein